MTPFRPAWPAALLLALAPCASAQPLPAADAAVRDQVIGVPFADAAGQPVRIQARLCRPPGDAPARLVVINHGSPANAADRPGMQMGRCDSEAARWFLARGDAVLFPLRRGYGITGGAWAEANGGCATPDYVRAGVEGARDIDAAVNVATTLPFIRPGGVIVVGQSAGGWGAIAYDSLPHPKVDAFVALAGGRGGHADGVPNRNCAPDRLAQAAGHFGATASTPMLWVYAANDSFFAPGIATALHAAFTAAGGQAQLIQPGRYDGDGHRLFFGSGGSAVWGPMVAAYLATRPE